MIGIPRLAAALSMLVGVSAAVVPWALAEPNRSSWMSEDAMRGAFIGKTLDGHYADGEDWTETYRPDGRLDYRDRRRPGIVGYWYFRDHVFCTFYDPGQAIDGGCFTALQESANCYEFYLAGFSEREADKEVPPGPVGRWVARASRQGEPSTCAARPTV